MKSMRLHLGMSLRDAAKVTGMSHVNVGDIEADKIKPSFEKVMRLLNAYQADMQEFLMEVGYLPGEVGQTSVKPKRVPLISWVAAGQWSAVCDPFPVDESDEWVDSDVKGEHLFALQVKGDSMEPEFTEGDVIIVDPCVNSDPGDYVIVKNDEGETTLKQLKQYGKIQVLHPLNPKYPDIELSDKHEYVVVGRVAEKKKRY